MENIRAKFHELLGVPYKLHVSTSGSGPTLILLHGIATSSDSWKYLVPLLNDRYKCITIDLIGFGDSPKPNWYAYDPKEHIMNIHHTLKYIKVKKPYILVGHSMGALLAVRYAAQYKNEVSKLILLSPPVYNSEQEIKTAKKIWRDALYAKAYRYIRTHKKFTLKGAAGLKSLVLRNNPFSISEDTWLSFSKSLENTIEKQNVHADLEQISCPIEIFYGNVDQLLIKKNIYSLGKFRNVQFHTLRIGHAINMRYSLAVSAIL
jgi:pimeloyl-ACP methyl ester carboxylesterase